MSKLLELFKRRIWKTNLDDQNRLELYKNIHQASKNMGRCLDELLYEYKTDQLEIEKPIELIIIPQKGSKEEELHD